MADTIDASERLTSPAQIGAVLRRLHEEHTLLTASFMDSADMFNTAVLDVDVTAGVVLLDALNPGRGHERVQPGSQLRFESKLQGVETRFATQVIAIEQDDKGPYYRARLPGLLIHRQRRRYHRVPIRLTFQAMVAFADDTRTGGKARLTDLSVGGIGGVVTDGPPLTQGSVYMCTLQMPKQPPFTVEVEIRFAGQVSPRGQQRFGAMFRRIEPTDQRRIERMVMELEREIRRVT